MKFVVYIKGEGEHLGVMTRDEKGILPLRNLRLHRDFRDMNDLIADIDEKDLKLIGEAVESSREDIIGKDSVRIITPVRRTLHDIICVGLNYRKHYEETRVDFAPKDESSAGTIYFSKRATKTIGPGDNIVVPADLDRDIDYECELAVIIGRRGRGITRDEAENYIFGYTIINDVSARSLQKGHSQWYLGKSVDTFTSMGPCIVHRSSLPMPLELRITSTLNGEIRQDSNTRHMMKSAAEIIEEVSRGITLEPGDIIATGTPEGVGMGFSPPRYMKPGDTIVCEVEGIGRLVNKVI